jgi:NhaP-type Na+/H+ or K+/H+ antiporter
VFCAETTIFVIAGILIGTKVFAVANSNIGMDDFYKLLILYVCMVLARFISISLFMGVLPNLGYGLTWR